jgi:hypothetical protein
LVLEKYKATRLLIFIKKVWRMSVSKLQPFFVSSLVGHLMKFHLTNLISSTWLNSQLYLPSRQLSFPRLSVDHCSQSLSNSLILSLSLSLSFLSLTYSNSLFSLYILLSNFILTSPFRCLIVFFISLVKFTISHYFCFYILVFLLSFLSKYFSFFFLSSLSYFPCVLIFCPFIQFFTFTFSLFQLKLNWLISLSS